MTRTGSLTSSNRNSDIARTDLPRQFLTLSNLLSILRMLLCIPFALIMLSGSPTSPIWGAVLMVLAALTDKLDGVLARKLHQTSDWGKILDPLADKIAIATVVLVLLVLNLLPMWFVWLSLGRDAAILAGGIYLRTRRGLLLPSNELGKWTVGIVSLYLFLLIVHGPQWAVDIFVSCSVVLLVVSFALYAHRFLYLLRNTGAG